MKNVVLDTSALMENNNIIDSFVDMYGIIINVVTLEELNTLKDGRDVEKSRNARRAILKIEKFADYIQFDNNNYLLEGFSDNCNDNSIIGCAIQHKAYLYTHDIAMKVKAKTLKVNCILLDAESQIYKGYVEYTFDTDQYNTYWGQRQEYFKQYFVNQYVIITLTDQDKIIEYRFNGEDLVPLVLPSSKVIKGKNPLQRCVLDMLYNKDIDICAVMGMVGSGKTYLALRMALNALQKAQQGKILGIREPTGEGERIGYLKGDFDDKTAKFFKPIIQSLEGGEREFEEMTDNGEFESEIPFYLKGTTYDETVIIADEAEDLTEKQIRLIGTRLGKGSRIFFSGDYSQSINNTTISNPLVKMCEAFKGNPRFACVYLDEDVRSEASKMFANLVAKNT